MKQRKRFKSRINAEAFAKKVNGQVNDCRNIETAKSPFTVTYKIYGYNIKRKNKEWSSEGRTFGYPDWYWK